MNVELDKLIFSPVKESDLPEFHEVQSIIFGSDAIKWDWWIDVQKENLFFLKIETSSPPSEIIGGIAVLEHSYRVAYIYVLFIRKDVQRKGIGKFLMGKIIKELKQMGYRSLFLHAKVDNDATIKFYQDLGFLIMRRLPEYYRSGDDAFELEITF